MLHLITAAFFLNPLLSFKFNHLSLSLSPLSPSLSKTRSLLGFSSNFRFSRVVFSFEASFGRLLRNIVMTCFPFLFSRNLDSPPKFSSDIDDELSRIQNFKIFTYKELKNATDEFSEAHKIGEGGFGPVYKARLKGGSFVAVKVLKEGSGQGVKEFLTEINVISEIEHENLVKIHGCCVEDNHRILVYNYLENNSLAQTLLGKNPNHIRFTWRTRLGICIGVARGLAFLHDQIQPHIVHRDIKAGNILLDTDLTPKISDFGLAKLIPANMTHVSTRVAGTLGYLAPEYAINGRLTRKADVYSFGVLLVEIVCGRCNTNRKLPIEEKYLLERVWEHFERRELVGMVDESLNGDFDAEEACRLLKVGLLCTQDNPKKRPSMSGVVKMLSREVAIDDEKIKKPILFSDFLQVKVRAPKNTSGSENQATNFSSESSGSAMMGSSSSTLDRSV